MQRLREHERCQLWQEALTPCKALLMCSISYLINVPLYAAAYRLKIGGDHNDIDAVRGSLGHDEINAPETVLIVIPRGGLDGGVAQAVAVFKAKDPHL